MTRGAEAMREQAHAWEPLARGGLRRKCLDWIEDITGALRDEPPVCASLGEASVGTGFSGTALFFLYRHLVWGRHDDLDAAFEHLNRAIETATRDFGSPSLLAGLPGIGWAIEHTRQALGDQGADPLEDVDEAVELMAARLERDRGEFDLLYGLAGLGVYALERLPRIPARRILESVVRGLRDQAVVFPDGLAWKRYEKQGDREAVETINLGIAHGVPGIIGVLAMAWNAGILPETTGPMLERATSYLIAQRQASEGDWRFPSILRIGDPPYPSRPTWCYGDPGIACVLHQAAAVTDRPDWEAVAVETSRAAARRPIAGSGVTGATFCHGSAGTALLLARLSQATGDPAIRQAAIDWCQELVAQRRPGEGVGGVLSDPPPHGFENWRHDPSLLTGAVGVGLSLLALATPVEPSWDRLFLLSPSRRNHLRPAAADRPRR